MIISSEKLGKCDHTPLCQKNAETWRNSAIFRYSYPIVATSGFIRTCQQPNGIRIKSTGGKRRPLSNGHTRADLTPFSNMNTTFTLSPGCAKPCHTEVGYTRISGNIRTEVTRLSYRSPEYRSPGRQSQLVWDLKIGYGFSSHNSSYKSHAQVKSGWIWFGCDAVALVIPMRWVADTSMISIISPNKSEKSVGHYRNYQQNNCQIFEFCDDTA